MGVQDNVALGKLDKFPSPFLVAPGGRPSLRNIRWGRFPVFFGSFIGAGWLSAAVVYQGGIVGQGGRRDSWNNIPHFQRVAKRKLQTRGYQIGVSAQEKIVSQRLPPPPEYVSLVTIWNILENIYQMV